MDIEDMDVAIIAADRQHCIICKRRRINKRNLSIGLYAAFCSIILGVFATVWEINSSVHTWGVFQCVDLSLSHLDGDNVHPILCIEDKEPSSHRTNSDEQSTTVHGQRRGRFL